MADRADTFDRADSLSLGTPSDGGSAWVPGGIDTAAWGIGSDHALGDGGNGHDYLECSESDGEVGVTVRVLAGNMGLMFRYTDDDNYFKLYLLSGFATKELLEVRIHR